MKALFARFGYAPAIVVPRIASLCAVLIFTRVLPPDQFGLYALVIVYGELLDAVALGWSRLGVQRFHHVVGINVTDLRRKAGLVALAGVGMGALLAALLAFGNAATSSWPFYALLLLYFLGAGLLRHGLNILRAEENVFFYVLIECVRPILGLAAAWLLVTRPNATFVAPSLGNFGVTALFAICLLALTARAVTTGGRKVQLSEFLRYSVPLIGVFLVSQVINASDRYLLAAYGGPALVGIYAACTSIARPAIETLFNIVNTSAFPRLIRVFEQHGEAAAAKELQGQLGILLLIGLPALVGLWLVARPLSEVLLDARYHQDAEWIIRLSSLAAFLTNLKSFFSDQVFHLRRNSVLQTATLLPGAFISVVGCIYAIPAHGGLGAAGALVLGSATSTLLSVVIAQRCLAVAMPWSLFARTLLGCLAMTVVARSLITSGSELMLAVTIIACAATYAAVCLGTGVGRLLDRQAL